MNFMPKQIRFTFYTGHTNKKYKFRTTDNHTRNDMVMIFIHELVLYDHHSAYSSISMHATFSLSLLLNISVTKQIIMHIKKINTLTPNASKKREQHLLSSSSYKVTSCTGLSRERYRYLHLWGNKRQHSQLNT